MLKLFIGTLHSSSEPIRYVINHFRDRRGAALLRYRNRTEITVVRTTTATATATGTPKKQLVC